jgi:predicted SAM-dependent methyltransferase
MRSIAKFLFSRFLYIYRIFLGGDRRVIANYFKSNSVRKVQIGAGSHPINGWLNSDYFPLKLNIIHIDATRKFPIESDTIDYVFNEHMIEHIPYIDAVYMLGEIYRILKPGGILRVATPDINFVFNLMNERKSDVEERYVEWAVGEFTPYAHSSSKSLFVVNNFFYNFGHRFIYDKTLLERILLDVGFRVVKEMDILKSEENELTGLENDKKLPEGFLKLESMTFEAIK